MTTEESQTESALADKVKEFLTQFKDPTGSFSYVEQIDQMMPKRAKYIVVDFNDLVSVPFIESKFVESPDEILNAFSRAIKEILQERFPEYARKIEHDIRARIANFPAERSLRQINSEVITKMILYYVHERLWYKTNFGITYYEEVEASAKNKENE